MGVQRHNVPHFKGLIVLYFDSRSGQYFSLPPLLFEMDVTDSKIAVMPLVSFNSNQARLNL